MLEIKFVRQNLSTVQAAMTARGHHAEPCPDFNDVGRPGALVGSRAPAQERPVGDLIDILKSPGFCGASPAFSTLTD